MKKSVSFLRCFIILFSCLLGLSGCIFNRENPSMIPIDSLDICHIFGYIDYLKDKLQNGCDNNE